MGSDRYCLRWNNHQNNLLGVFSQLLQEESLVDVTLACSEGHSIRAHKVVLSACSSYFQSLFLDHPNRHPIIILKDVCFAELRTLVEFMYRGEVNLEYCQLPTFLKTAESLQVKGLAEMTHLGSSLSPEREMLPSRDGPMPSQDHQLPSSVITTTATLTAHEPLPLIRRRSGSPSDLEPGSGMLNDTLTQSSQQYSPMTVRSVSPPRPPTASGLESSQSRSPPSRLPLSVSPHPADTSSNCEDRSMSPDPDDDVSSIQSGPSDMTINSQIPSPIIKSIPGPSNLPPVQHAPLSLKKESANDWDKNNEDRSSSGNNGSDYSISRHLQDTPLSTLESMYRLPHHNFLLPSASATTTALTALTISPSSVSSPPSLDHLSSATSSRSSTPFLFPPFPAGLSVLPTFFSTGESALHPLYSYLAQQQQLLALANANANAKPTYPSPSDISQRSYFRCAICRAAFPSHWLLEQHTMLQHSGQNPRRSAGNNSSDSGGSGSREEKPFQCDQCGQSYRYRSAYLKHREQNHRARLPADKLFTCDICGMQFRYLKSFKKHRSNHTLEMLQLVPGAAGHKRDLKQLASQVKNVSEAGEEAGGVSEVSSSNEVVPQSSASAANKEESIDSLSAAMPNATPATLYGLLRYPPERPRERQLFACSYCSKTVRSKENLKLHVRKHTGERPFACLFCGRAFGGKSDLTRHVRIHTGERPYHCEMCGKCFARADYLSKHLTTHLHNSHNSRSATSTE